MRADLVALSPALDAREVEDIVDEPGQPLALARDHRVVLAPGSLVGNAAELEGLPEHANEGERRLEVVGNVGHEVGLEPGHLRLPLDHAVGRPQPEGDDHEEEEEGGHEEHGLAPHVAP